MKTKIALLIALGLGGCDQPVSKELPPPPLPANSEFGRWTVVPASNAPDIDKNGKVWSAWRLDTKTGDLEFCTYVFSESLDPNKMPIEQLICSMATKGDPSD
jgi:hypothetical protein